MKHRKLIAGILLATLILSAFIPFLGPLVKADSKASRTTVSKAGQIVTCYDDGTFLDDRGLVTLGSSYRNIRTGLKFEGFNNITKDSRIDSATLRIYYYTGIDFNTTTEAQLLIEAIKDGAPEFLTWDGVVNGWDSDHITWFNMSWLNTSGYYDITLNPDMIQELVLSSPWLHKDTPENGSIVLRTWNTAPVGPGFQRYHYEIPTGEPSLNNLRPTLTITYTPGVYDDGYVITPGAPGGSTIFQAIVEEQTSTNHYLEANFTSELIFNDTLTDNNNIFYHKCILESVGGMRYLIWNNATSIYVSNSSDGITWEVFADRGVASIRYTIAWDQTRQYFHVVYNAGYDAYYSPLYLNGTWGNTLYEFTVLDGAYNSQDGLSIFINPLDNKTWFVGYGGAPSGSGRRTKVRTLSSADVWSDRWEDITDTRIGFISTVGSSVVLGNYYTTSKRSRAHLFTGNDTVLSFTYQGSIYWGTVPAVETDFIAGIDNNSIPVMVFMGLYYTTGYLPTYWESYDLGITWTTANPALGVPVAGWDGLALMRDEDLNIYAITIDLNNHTIQWGEYEDHVYHRDNITSYDANVTDSRYLSAKREMGSSGGLPGSATWDPFEPDPPIPGFNETCIDRQLRINFGAGPYNESEVQQAIDYCEDWIPGNETEPDPLTSGISKKSFKLYYLVIGTASIVIPWLLYAFTSDPEYIGWILLLNALGLGLLIEFIRL